MRKFYIAVVALVATFALGACNKTPEVDLGGAATPMEIRFSAHVGDTTRVNGTNFEQDDAFSLVAFQGDMMYLNNAYFYYNDKGIFEAVTPCYWPEDKNTESVFYAVYPYADYWATDISTYYIVGVQLDQSTHEHSSFSDMMLACAVSKPTSKPIDLQFERLNAKIELEIDNQINCEVTSVSFGNVAPLAALKFDPTKSGIDSYWALYDLYYETSELLQSDFEQSFPRTTIKAGLDNNDVWSVIIPKQLESAPTITVVMADNTSYSFMLTNTVDFEAGKRYSATITIDKNTEANLPPSETPINLGWTIMEWDIYPYDLVIEEDGVTPIYVRNIFGWKEMYLYAWDLDLVGTGNEQLLGEWPGTLISNNVVNINGIDYYAYSFPKEWLGKNVGIIVNDGLGTQTYDHIIYNEEDDTYGLDGKSHLYNVLKFEYPDGIGGVYTDYGLSPYSPSSDARNMDFVNNMEWSLIGSMSNWTEDIPTYVRGYVVVAEGVEIEAEDLFKFRANGAWDYNFGTGDYVEMSYYDEEGDYYYSGWYYAQYYGDNCVMKESGVYNVRLEPKFYSDYTIYGYIQAEKIGEIGDNGGDNGGDTPVTQDRVITIAGTMNDWQSDNDLVMSYNEVSGLYYYSGLMLTTADEFKFCVDRSWTENYGLEGGSGAAQEAFAVEAECWYSLMQDGANIKVSADGLYDIYFDDSNKTFYLTPRVIGLVGTMNEWGNLGDYVMTYSEEYGYYLYGPISLTAAVREYNESGEYWELVSGDEFKIRISYGWAENYGADYNYSDGSGVVYLESGSLYQGVQDGCNCSVTTSGEYYVLFSDSDKSIAVINAEDLI